MAKRRRTLGATKREHGDRAAGAVNGLAVRVIGLKKALDGGNCLRAAREAVEVGAGRGILFTHLLEASDRSGEHTKPDRVKHRKEINAAADHQLGRFYDRCVKVKPGSE